MADTTALKNRIRAAIKANGNQEITGPVLQQALLDMVDELDLNPELENEATTRGDADTRLSNLITGIKNNIDNGYVYAGIAIPTTSPVSGKVFYMAVQAGTYTNFGGTAVTEGITILKYNGASWVKEQVLSDNLVKSGDGPDDFSIQDEAGNILCLWKDGHIKTKNFSSSTLNQVIFGSTVQTTNKANYGTIEDLDQALTPGIFLWKQDGKQAGIVQCFLDNLNHTLTQILCTNYQLTDSDNNVLNFAEIADKDSAKKGTFSSHQHTMHTYVRTYGYADDFVDNQSSAQKLEKGWSGWVGLLLDSEWYSNLKLICQSWFRDFSDIIIDDGPDDFSIQDEEGNTLCLWKDGHIKTKNFDSRNLQVSDNGNSFDFDIEDENQNILVGLKDGHIRTKNFDSKETLQVIDGLKNEQTKVLYPLKDKKIVILGDSITDFTGYIDVLRNLTKATIYNRGVSGTCVAARSGRTDSFVERIQKANSDLLNDKGNGLPSKLDMAIIYGGTNDYWWGFNSESLGTIESLYSDTNSFYGAYKSIINLFLTKYPGIKVYLCTLLNQATDINHAFNDYMIDSTGKITSYSRTFQDNKTVTKLGFCNCIKEIANLYNVEVIDLHSECQLNGYNSDYRTLLFGNSEETVHPNAIEGKTRLAKCIYNHIIK